MRHSAATPDLHNRTAAKRKLLWLAPALAALLIGGSLANRLIGEGAAVESNLAADGSSDAMPSGAPVAISSGKKNIRLETQPPGAAAWLNGRPCGLTPIELRADAASEGGLALRIAKDGYLTVDRVLGPEQFESGASLRIALQASGMPVPVGAVDKSSSPEPLFAAAEHVGIIVNMPLDDAARDRAAAMIDDLAPTNNISLAARRQDGTLIGLADADGPASPAQKVRAFDALDALRRHIGDTKPASASAASLRDCDVILWIHGKSAELPQLHAMVGNNSVRIHVVDP